MIRGSGNIGLLKRSRMDEQGVCMSRIQKSWPPMPRAFPPPTQAPPRMDERAQHPTPAHDHGVQDGRHLMQQDDGEPAVIDMRVTGATFMGIREVAGKPGVYVAVKSSSIFARADWWEDVRDISNSQITTHVCLPSPIRCGESSSSGDQEC